MLGLIKNELYKAFRLKKFYFFMLAIAGIETAVIIQKKYGHNSSTASLMNGQSFPLALLEGISFIMVVFIAVFIADIWIDEYRVGTFKLMLLRPVSRITLLNAKIISLMTCSAILMCFTIAFAYVVGVLAFGWGEGTIINGVEYGSLFGIGITLSAAVAMLFPILGFGMLVTLVALWTDNIGVTIGGALGFMIISQVLEISEGIRKYSIIYLIRSFHKNFINGFSWDTILINAAVIATYVILCYIGCLLLFRKKDLVT